MKSLHFLYHELRPEKSRYSYVVPSREFQEHCALFAELRRISLPHGLRPEVTFDDGNLSDATLAAPVLASFGLKANFFLTAGWTGQKKGFMGWSELRGLLQAGHKLGAHGMTHKLLTQCSSAELREELQGARLRLEDGLGVAVEIMSLPGGRHSTQVLGACREAGYTQVFTSEPKAENLSQSSFTIGRLNLMQGITSDWLRRVLDERSGTLKRLQRAAQIKAGAKRLLGDRLYAQLWAFGNQAEVIGDAVADPSGIVAS